MSFHVTVGSRQHHWSDAQVQHRLRVLDRYYSYREVRNENIVSAVIRAVAHIFHSLNFAMTFGSHENANSFLVSIEPQIKGHGHLWSYYSRVDRYRNLRPAVVVPQPHYTRPIPYPFMPPVFHAPTTDHASRDVSAPVAYYTQPVPYPFTPPVFHAPTTGHASRDVSAPVHRDARSAGVSFPPRLPESRDTHSHGVVIPMQPRRDLEERGTPARTPARPPHDASIRPMPVPTQGSGRSGAPARSSEAPAGLGRDARSVVPGSDDDRRKGSGHVNVGSRKQ